MRAKLIISKRTMGDKNEGEGMQGWKIVGG